MVHALAFFNHHPRESSAPVDLWQDAAERAVPLCLAAAASSTTDLHILPEIEINLVDDEIIARVHADFLNDPSPTDVITFPHGEIFVSLDTARRAAAEHGEPYEREVLRYLVHGLLHLAGWSDLDPAERAAMHEAQERIVRQVSPADPS